MRYDDVIRFYGTQAAVARALGIKPAAVAQWASAQRVPVLRQLQIEDLTRGALKADDPIRRQAVDCPVRRRRRTDASPEQTAFDDEGGALMLPRRKS